MVITDKPNKEKSYYLLLIVALIFIIVGFVFNPSLVANYFSSDGVLTIPTILNIYLIELYVITLGSILFFYSLISIIKSDFAVKIRNYFKKVDIWIDNILFFLKFYKKNDSLLLQRVIKFWLVLLFLLFVSGLLTTILIWEKASGYEYLWIAQSIEGGHGFSFPSVINSTKPVESYNLTAHEEPVYPYFMAFTTKFFGRYGRLVVLIIQVVAIFLTSFAIYHLARKIFNPATGLLASLIFFLFPGPGVEHAMYFGPISFAGLIISVSAYLIIWCSENLSVRKGMFLGFILGFSTLIYAQSLLYIPISILFMVITVRPYRTVILKTAFAILFTAIIVISPWTVRNYQVFGKFIPVKTTMGKLAYIFNPLLATTFLPGHQICTDDSYPLRKAKDAKEALDNSIYMGTELLNLSVICNKGEEPEGYKFNEAEWDRVYLKKTFDFIISHPRTYASLAFYRIAYFFSYNSLKITILSIISGIGILLALRNKQAWLLILFILTYLAPYLMALPVWYRFRYPIEPIILILACYVPVLTFSKLYAIYRKI